jgi:3-dehydroquinate synthase
MVMAAELSVRLGWLDAADAARARDLLARLKLPVEPPPGIGAERWMELMAVDKKVLAGKLRLVLLRADFDPRSPGRRLVRHQVTKRPTA